MLWYVIIAPQWLKNTVLSNASKLYWVVHRISTKRSVFRNAELVYGWVQKQWGHGSWICWAMHQLLLIGESISQAVCSSCYWTIRWKRLMNYKDQNIVIMSDSQSAIRALRSLVNNSNMVWECLRKLNDLGRKNSHSPVGTRHVDWEGNEEADKLARKEAALFTCRARTFLWLGSHVLQRGDQKAAEVKR